MATGEDINVEAEALGGDAALELHGKEPVVRSGDDTSRNVWPGLERPWVGEGPVRLLRLTPAERFGDDVVGHVVEELGDDVEVVAEDTPITF